MVMLLHREDYYHRGESDYDQNNKAELIIAKQRNGPTGIVELVFREKITRFENASFAEQASSFSTMRSGSAEHPVGAEKDQEVPF